MGGWQRTSSAAAFRRLNMDMEGGGDLHVRDLACLGLLLVAALRDLSESAPHQDRPPAVPHSKTWRIFRCYRAAAPPPGLLRAATTTTTMMGATRRFIAQCLASPILLPGLLFVAVGLGLAEVRTTHQTTTHAPPTHRPRPTSAAAGRHAA